MTKINNQYIDNSIKNRNIIRLDNYTKYTNKMSWQCSICGYIWNTTTNSILRGTGCNKCCIERASKRYKHSKELFIERANIVHDNFYCYENFVYKTARIPGEIICPQHGPFYQTADNHINKKQKCPHCSKENLSLQFKLSKDEFIKRSNIIHNNLYLYTDVEYKNFTTKIIIICPIHGKFEQTAGNHLSGRGCSLCNMSGANETLIYNLLLNNNIYFKHNYDIRNINKGYDYRKVDFYIPDFNLIIEYNGEQHYQPVRFGNISQLEAEQQFDRQKQRDLYVNSICKLNNIKLIDIDGRIYKYNKLINHISELIQGLGK
jgi:hypothetical protein